MVRTFSNFLGHLRIIGQVGW